MTMRFFLFLALFVAAFSVVHADVELPTFTNYNAFRIYWEANPSKRPLMFQRYREWGFQWMTERPGRITRLYWDDPKILCGILVVKPELIQIWWEQDNHYAQLWINSDYALKCFREYPLTLYNMQDEHANRILIAHPILFISFYKADIDIATNWARRNLGVYQQLYNTNNDVKHYVDQVPVLRQLVTIPA
jgi:hypothetical protein